jgi:hypothetical protein
LICSRTVLTVVIFAAECLYGPKHISALRHLPGFAAKSNTWIKRRGSEHFQAYGRAQWFIDHKSGLKASVEYEPKEPWLAAYAITFYADDRSGLVRDRVLSILAELPPAELKKVEVAVDFAMTTPVDRNYVKRYGLFGKSKRDRKGVNTAGDWWGSRRGGKRVVSYLKHVIAAQRIEFKVRGRFFKQYGIRDILDFAKFTEILPRRHLLFARLDERKLITRLSIMGINARERLRILRDVRQRSGDLGAALDYLRQVVGVKNVRRLLVPLKTNTLVLEAFKRFAAEWAVAPRRSK